MFSGQADWGKKIDTRRSLQVENVTGMVHFDVSEGCTAEMLNGALLDLGLPLEGVVHAFKQLGINHVEPSFSTENHGRFLGGFLDLVDSSGSSLFKPLEKERHANLAPGRKQKYSWGRKQQETAEGSEKGELEASVDFKPVESFLDFDAEGQDLLEQKISGWLRNEKGTLEELIAHVQSTSLTPVCSALVQKTLMILSKSLKKSLGNTNAEPQLSGQYLVRLLCQVVTFCVLITDLNPLEVSASHLPLVSTNHSKQPLSAEGFDEQSWLLCLAEKLPTYERKWPAAFCEPVGLSLLKTVSSHFGPRGESHLLQSGVGVERRFKECQMLVRALWCKPLGIDTRVVDASLEGPRVLPFVQLNCLLGGAIDVPDLIRRLENLGAKSVVTSQVMERGVKPRTSLQLSISRREFDNVMEALLVTGEASEVVTLLAEKHQLLCRKVSVPFGRKQKKMSCGVNEWLLGDKVLRAEPVQNELMAIVATTGFAQDSVRSDVLAAWKKLRQN